MNKKLRNMAEMIAAEANKCCYRSDGYREAIYKMALVGLQNAVLEEREACAILCEKLGTKEYGSLYIAAAIRARGEA